MPKRSPTLTPPRFDALRTVLAKWDPPAGPQGFEGLVAQALAALSGYTFRLARSGAQFGRDAATRNAPFAIAMEAKRYNDTVSLEALAGKASLAAFALADKVDVWILAATVETSEPTEKMLAEILEGAGVALVNLDWPDTGLPPLGVLLAATRTDVLPWAAARLSPSAYRKFDAGLADIAARPDFDASVADLRAQLAPATVGLDAFRARNTTWGEERFANRRLAQQDFSQFLAPRDADEQAIARPRIQAALVTAIDQACADVEGGTIVAVLGGEGVGKSWAVVQWWLASDPRPILLLSAGRIADQLSANDEPSDMLARLAALQEGRRDWPAVARWRRRIERWAAGSADRGRFVVVIDGLNETSGKPWTTIIRALAPIVRDLGGVLIVTCRERYWDREIGNRSSYLAAAKVPVGDYDDDEFLEVITQAKLDVATLPVQLNRFMRNPRVCALAIQLIPTLATVEDLGVERLLLEYWRQRLLERGDLVGHNDEDFRKLLINHARAYRERSGTDFDRDAWRVHSGAAARDDGRRIADDLSDIEEGRFFDSSQGKYAFRPEALHFALGLLVVDELREAAGEGADLVERLDAIIEAVRGFDMLTDILTAALAITALDPACPDANIAALVGAWMSLQNLTDDAVERLVPICAARPEPFLDAFENRGSDNDDGRLTEFLLYAKRREEVARALDARTARWLGSWTRVGDGWGSAEERAARDAQRHAQIDARLADLTPDERTFFDTNCTELPRAAALAEMAVLNLVGQEHERFARAIVAFAFSYTISGSRHLPLDDLSWAIRLNRRDHAALADAVRRDVAAVVTDAASMTARQAGGIALRLLGTRADQTAGDVLHMGGSVSAEPDRFDPLDPASPPPAVPTGKSPLIDAINPGQVWLHMSSTSEDHDLERSTNFLLRQDPTRLTQFLDRVAASASDRDDLALRQLSWRLPWLSPLMSNETADVIERRIADVVADPALAPDGDVDFITAMMVEGIMPKRSGAEQLALLQSLPDDAKFYLRYSTLAKPVDSGDAVSMLARAMQQGARHWARALFFLAAAPPAITDDIRVAVRAALTSGARHAVTAAMEFVRYAQDDALDDALLALPTPHDRDRGWHAYIHRAAFATAVARRQRDDLVDAVPVSALDWVALKLPSARPRLAQTIQAALDRLSQPVALIEPEDAIITIAVSDDGANTTVSLDDRGERRARTLQEMLGSKPDDVMDATGARFRERQRQLNEQLDQFMNSLDRDSAQMLAGRPQMFGLTALAADDPDRHRGWIETILAIDDAVVLRRLQNLALMLAESFTEIDGDLSSRLFVHVWAVEPYVNVVVGLAKHPIRALALFRARRSAEIDALRAQAFESALDDVEIERLVLAAQVAGAEGWIDAFVADRLASDHPTDQAMAVTIASFRTANPQSDAVFDDDWGRGFQAAALRSGRARYERAAHAKHWFDLAAAANDPLEIWRYMELGIAAADRRSLLDDSVTSITERPRLGGDVPQRLSRAAAKASEETGKLLLGMRKPTGKLALLLRSDAPLRG